MKKLLIAIICLVLVGCSGTKEVKKTKTVTDKKTEYAGTVIIDPGHQGKQNTELEPIGPGAKEKKVKVTSGTAGKWSKKTEAEINLIIGLQLQKELEKRHYKVVMVRTSQNVNISNKERAEIANKAKGDAFIRLHCNGGNNPATSGALAVAPTKKNTFLNPDMITKSNQLSKDVLNYLCKATGAKNRGLQYNDKLTGTNWSKVPTTVIEMGFMTNKEEDLKLANAEYQKKLCQGMSDGIDAYMKRK